MKNGQKELAKSLQQNKRVFFNDVPMTFEDKDFEEFETEQSYWKLLQEITFQKHGKGLKELKNALNRLRENHEHLELTN